MLVPWKDMNAHETFVSLLNAPKKIAGPWVEPALDRLPACRRGPDGHTVVWEYGNKVTIHAFAVLMSIQTDSPADAAARNGPLHFTSRAAADAWLRDHGWLLDDEPVDASTLSLAG